MKVCFNDFIIFFPFQLKLLHLIGQNEKKKICSVTTILTGLHKKLVTQIFVIVCAFVQAILGVGSN